MSLTGQSCNWGIKDALNRFIAKEIAKIIKDLFQLIPSATHMSGMDFGRLEPTPVLLYSV